MIQNVRLVAFSTLVAGSCLLAGQPRVALATFIDFDDVANGTVIDTHYPGVTFGCVICASGHAFARDMNTFGSSTAASGLNVVSLVDPAFSVITSFDTRSGAVSAVFATPQRLVSIDARPQLPLEFLGAANNKPFLELYSSATQNASTLIARVVYPLNYGDPGYCSPSASACGGTWQTLSYLSSSDNIVSIRLSSQNSQPGPVVYGDFDNLRFETSPSLLRAAAYAEFASDFNSGAPAELQLFGGARIDSGFLKLLTLPNDTFGIAYVSDFNNGQWVYGFDATFDVSLFGSTCCGGGFFPADGFSFNLVPAASALANPGYGEPGEEGLAEGLTVTFDTWDNGGGEAPAIDVKWLGQTLTSVSIQVSQSPNGVVDPNLARRAVNIHLDTDGTIDVSYGGVVLINNFQTPYQPGVVGVPKWILGARVGSANDNYWFDNLHITSFAGPQRCLDFNSTPIAGLNLFGSARVDGGFLKLITVPNDSFGIAYVPDFGGALNVLGFRATFKAALFGSTCCGNGQFPADGFSFNLVPAATVRPTPGYGEPGEEGLEEGLAVNFDTWDNGNSEAPAIEVKWLGQVIATAPFQASQSPSGAPNAATASRDVLIDLRTDGTLDVSYGGTKVLNNVQTPYDASVIGEPVWVMGARVGGANDNHWIDDLCITTIAGRARPIPGLFGTGVGEDRVPLGEDQVDPHYVLIPNGPAISPSFPVYTATTNGGFPIPPWLPYDRGSAWISQSPDTIIQGATSFIYQTTFDLAGLNPSTARIVGRWAADDRGLSISLNGGPVTAPPAPGFDAWTSFSINSGFVAGTNTLRFVIFNDPDISQPDLQNPGGLRVELSGTADLDCNATPTRPSLHVSRLGNTVETSWHGPGWILQGASVVTGPWTPLMGGSTANGADFKATFPSAGNARFFRLQRDCN